MAVTRTKTSNFWMCIW